jgi:uncharacterized RDD family membrane protein YckC
MSIQPDQESAHLSTVPIAARQYQGRRAGIVTRMVANGIDLVVIVLILGLIYGIYAGVLFLLHPRSFTLPSGLGWSMPVIGFVVVVPYLTISWLTTGRTYGDALLGLRVVNSDGRRLNYVVAVLRAVAYVIFPIGVFWVAVSSANRSVQDILLRTSVVYDWTPIADLR